MNAQLKALHTYAATPRGTPAAVNALLALNRALLQAVGKGYKPAVDPSLIGTWLSREVSRSLVIALP